MYKFSKSSKEKLETCHPLLQAIANEVIKEIDITVTCGHRGEKEQNEAYERKLSKVKYPNSKHNYSPSLAIDLAPYPIDWDNIERFEKMAEVVKKKANELGILIAWGGDWKMKDYPHFELK